MTSVGALGRMEGRQAADAQQRVAPFASMGWMSGGMANEHGNSRPAATPRPRTEKSRQ
jgi:hypothetical protein